MKRSIILAVLLAGGAIGIAAPAYADCVDDVFRDCGKELGKALGKVLAHPFSEERRKDVGDAVTECQKSALNCLGTEVHDVSRNPSSVGGDSVGGVSVDVK